MRRGARAAGRWVAVVAALSAAACASQSGRLKTDTFQARKRLTRELIAHNDWAAAFAYADDLHRENPRDSEALVLRGTIYRERGLPAEAESDLREAVHLDDGSAEAHAALGILYDVTLRPTLAEPEHRRAVKLAPNSPAYLNNLGFSLFLHGRTQDAVGFYQQAARLDPTSRRVRTNLGFAYAALGDLRRASHEFEMAGTPAEARNNLGFAYERRGDFGHAYDLYLEAARLDPGSSRARSNLVHAAAVLGRPVPADVSSTFDGTAEVTPPPSALPPPATPSPSPSAPQPTDEEKRP